MGRLWKLILALILIAGLAFVGYAYFGDLNPAQEDVSEPVDLGAG